MTDGYIGYEAEVLKFLRAEPRRREPLRVRVGSSVNRYLIDGMARMGGGEPFVLLGRSDENTGDRSASSAPSREPAFTSIEVDWGGLDVKEVTPNRAPDLFADRPLVARRSLRARRPGGDHVARPARGQALRGEAPGPAARGDRRGPGGR